MSLDRSRWNVQYMQRVLAADPSGYWMQDEKQGGVSYDMVTARSNGARNGAYTGPTLGQPGIGDGRTGPFFDGANDFNNIHSASFAGVFDGTEGTVIVWGRVANAGVWTDGTTRYLITIGVDVNNILSLRKSSVNNTLLWVYVAGGTIEQHAVAAFSNLVYFSMGMTWSRTDDAVVYYLNGARLAQDILIGAWVGALSATETVIGARTTTPTQEWHGYLAHVPVWDRVLSPAEMLSLGVL